jgi:hypothetical protein
VKEEFKVILYFILYLCCKFIGLSVLLGELVVVLSRFLGGGRTSVVLAVSEIFVRAISCKHYEIHVELYHIFP